MTDSDLIHMNRARETAEAALERMVSEGAMTAGTAGAMAGAGFLSAVRTLSELYAAGVDKDCITTAFENDLRRAREAGDQQLINAGEFTLAVWGGMQEDLAAHLRGGGVQQR